MMKEMVTQAACTAMHAIAEDQPLAAAMTVATTTTTTTMATGVMPTSRRKASSSSGAASTTTAATSGGSRRSPPDPAGEAGGQGQFQGQGGGGGGGPPLHAHRHRHHRNLEPIANSTSNDMAHTLQQNVRRSSPSTLTPPPPPQPPPAAPPPPATSHLPAAAAAAGPLSSSSSSSSSSGQPACLLWARDLQSLLNDDEGCGLFEKYLRQENCDQTDLMFVYACNGLRAKEAQKDRDKQARVIYRWVKSGAIRAISDDAKEAIAAKVRNKDQPLEADIFDVARKQVEDYIMRTTYARFIQSDLYIDYVQRHTTSYRERGDEEEEDDDVIDEGDELDGDDRQDELADQDELDRNATLVSLPSDSEDDGGGGGCGADGGAVHQHHHVKSGPTMMMTHHLRNIQLNNNNNNNNNNSYHHHTATNNNNNTTMKNHHNNNSHHHRMMTMMMMKDRQDITMVLGPNTIHTLAEDEEELENATFAPPPPTTTLARKPLLPPQQHGGSVGGGGGSGGVVHGGGGGSGGGGNVHEYMTPGPVPPPLPPQSKAVQRQKRQSQLGISYGEAMLRHGGSSQRPPPNPYHVKSSAFVPPTAYNSDIQSMSSGNYTDLDTVTDADIALSQMRRSEQPSSSSRSAHHHGDGERRRPTRAWPMRDPMPHTVIPRTMFPNVQAGSLAEREPHEFFQKLYAKLVVLARERDFQARITPSGGIDDEMHSQSILDDHVDRVFKTPPVRTPRSPSPGSGPSRAAMCTAGGGGNNLRGSAGKSGYQQSSRGTTRRLVPAVVNIKESGDSAFYGVVATGGGGGSGPSAGTSGAVPRAQPRGKPSSSTSQSLQGKTLPSGAAGDMLAFDDTTGVLAGPNFQQSYNAQDSVREWINRPGADAGTGNVKSKASKASVCSGSNRSSCRSNHESASGAGSDRKKKGALSSSNGPSGGGNELVIGYTYEGESVPYVIRLPQRHVRLRDFKAQLTKKGNFRYFFKRPMDEFGLQGVFEEVKDDNELLPLWEGKIFAQIVQAVQDAE